VKLGVVFPQTEIGRDAGGVRAYAEAAEALGYDYLLTYEHVLGADPRAHHPWTGVYKYTDMFHEPMVMFGFLAAVTTRIEFVTGVLVLPQRQTALVAKQAAELDILSAGRVRIGIGVGWNAAEFQAMGSDFHTRGSRQEEQIDVLRMLWTKELVTFKGRFHTLDAVGLNPMPFQRPIPIWVGTYAERALRRAARLADGLMPGQVELDPRGRDIVAKFRQYAKEAGRDPEKLGLDCCVSLVNSTMERCIERALEWRSFGATHMRIDTMRAGLTGVQRHIDALRQFRDGLSARGI
jgi:probable F420-dependent oxidoreductase